MAVTWIDPPGLAISSRETLDFIVPTLPIAISVGYYTSVRVEERAFRDGTFLFPYLGSTIEGAGPYTFHLRRSGGWPDDAQVYVDEAPAVGGVPDWGVLYHVDFRTLGVQTLSGSGSVTIDGLTWYRKPGAVGYDGPGNISSSGMRAVGGGVSEGALAFIGPRMILPCSSIPGWNPNAPTVFYARTNSTFGGAHCVVGCADYSLNGTLPTLQEMERRQGLYFEGGASSGWVFYDGFQTANFNLRNPLQSAALTDVGIIIRPLDSYGVAFAGFDWSTPGVAGAPNPTTVSSVSPTQNGNDVRQTFIKALSSNGVTALKRDMSNLCFFTAINSGGATTAWLEELLVWQPGA